MKRVNFRIRLWLIPVVAVVALGLPGVAHATTNVVPNPGFEQGGCGSTPIICGWVGYPVMHQDATDPHSGSASMSLGCGPTGCYTGGWTSVSAGTDPAFCAAIGPGTHAASFWARGGWVLVSLGATFYQGLDCTAPLTSDSFGDWFTQAGWQQFTGDLVAPPGTQSALFEVSAGEQCDDFCYPGANFDDIDVEDAVTSDTTPPQTTITSVQAGGASTSASFEFSASEVSTFECSLDGAPFTSCVSPATYSGLSDGSHTFQVRATDRAGNTDPTPAEQSWTVASLGDFSIAASPASLSVVQGNGASSTIQTTVTSGSAQSVDLVAGVQPAAAGLTVWTSPSSIMAGDRAMLIVNTGAATPPGNYTITVMGVGTSWTHTTTVTLTVTCCGSDFSISANPSALTLAQGSSGTSTIQTTLTSGSAQTVLLSASVAEPGVLSSVSFAPGSVTMGGSSTMTVTVGAAAVPGTYTITVRGTTTNGSAIHDTTVDLTVQAAANEPPTASFTFSCSGLSCSVDGTSSRDPDGSIASYAWDFGDGSSGSGQTATHTYASARSYNVTLMVTDNGGATSSASKAVNPISLIARGYKQNGLEKVDLSWNGPSGASFDVYRNGTRIASVQATAYTDNLKKRGSGTYTYKVCATASATCSNEASVSF